MRIVIFGLTISSSWGNGHATIWRSLCHALASRGNEIIFFEKDVSYYASHRDLENSPDFQLSLYDFWENAEADAYCSLRKAGAAIVTSYCPDAKRASDLVCNSSRGVKIFYDLDSPVTLARLQRDEAVDYIPQQGLKDFDFVLSFTGGRALDELQKKLGARRVMPLYGSVAPECQGRVLPHPRYEADLSYLGTFAEDRQSSLEQLFIEPARRAPAKHFVLGGALYPPEFPWESNIAFVRHVPPPDHSAFYSSSKLTLNVTRADMAGMGYCPSGRLFEAAACATPVISDIWEGMDKFFEPGKEILIAGSPEDVEEVLNRDPAELASIGASARKRVLAQHTADHRAQQFMQYVQGAA